MAMYLTKIALLLATTIVLQLMFAVDRTQGQGQGNGNNGNKGNNGNTPNKCVLYYFLKGNVVWYEIGV